jgi:two-component system response regulator YesN
MTLLIADDERTIREGIASAVDWKSLGITRVMLASNGKRALAMISSEKPDIAIVDIVMPEMTGLELILECRKSRECPEFIIISGHDEFTYAQEALRNHVRNYILKPCNSAEIAVTVKSLVEELKRRQSMEEDRKELQERLDTLMPQARERLFHDFITGAKVGEGRLHTLEESLDAGDGRFQLLLFYSGEPERQRELAARKKAIVAEPALINRVLCTVVRDSLVVLFLPVDRRVIEETAERLCTENTAPAPGFLAALSVPGSFESMPQLYLLTHEAARRAFLVEGIENRSRVLETSTSPYSPAVQKSMRHIEEHFADSTLSLGKIAKQVLGLNADYLGKLFKKECKVTIGEYLLAVRMEQAKGIIAASEDVRIYEAAWQVGFGDDAAYFSQVFRKHTGIPPGEYRKRHEA